jgi:hypothetical protein
MNFSVTQFGKPLHPSKYHWNEDTKTFSTNEYNLVLDFTDINGVTFKTGFYCTFKTGSECTFNTSENCVAIRYDVTGIIELPNRKTIKLNGYEIPGYTVVEPTHTITIDGKEITLSNESFNELKKQLCS